MALTASEEALVRQILSQQAAILSLAGNEATITSKLGATKVTLADLVAASAVGDADLLLTRQGVTEKSLTPLLLKAYMAGEFVQLQGDTLLGSLALFGGDTGVTPAHLDNDTSLATTKFVKNSGSLFSSVVPLNASAVLTSAHGGKLVEFYGATASQTLTLPISTTLRVGDEVTIVNLGSVPVSVVRQAAEILIYGPGTNGTTVLVQPGDTVAMTANNGSWLAKGSAVNQFSDSFKSLKLGSGYQKLPSGVIIQWGSLNSNNGTATSVTFPITFPTACRAVIPAIGAASGGDFTVRAATIISTAASNFSYNATPTGAQFVNWIAIGN